MTASMSDTGSQSFHRGDTVAQSPGHTVTGPGPEDRVDNKRFGPGESSWPGKLGGEAADDDDVAGHMLGIPQPDADATESSIGQGATSQTSAEAPDSGDSVDDTEGHGLRVRGAP